MKLITMVLFYQAAGRLVLGFGSQASVAKGRTGFGLTAFKTGSTGESPESYFGDSVAGTAGKDPQTVRGPEVVHLARHAGTRKKWGIDNAHAHEYWFDNRIHTLGNIGVGGALHAALAPLSTKLIDVYAYEGVDVRAKVRPCKPVPYVEQKNSMPHINRKFLYVRSPIPYQRRSGTARPVSSICVVEWGSLPEPFTRLSPTPKPSSASTLRRR